MKYSLPSLMIVVALVCLLASSLSGEETKPGAAKPMVPNSEPRLDASEKLTKVLIDDASEQRCVTSPEEVVAIHAAWLRMDKFLHRQKDDPKARRTVDESGEYVLGFMEGRLEATFPKWWKEAVLSASVDDNRRVVFVIPDDRSERVAYGRTKWPAGTTITEQGTKGHELLEIVRGDQKVDALKQFITDEGHGAASVEFATINESAYLAFCFSHPSVTLLGIHKKEKKWTQLIHGEWFAGDSRGPGILQRAEIVVSRERIFVFAGTKSVIYFEVFDSNEGTRLSRFSSRAYDIEPKKP